MKEYKYKINGAQYTVAINKIEGEQAEVEVNGTPYTVEIQREKKATSVSKPVLQRPAVSAPTVKVAPQAQSSGSANAVKAPLPGVIIDITVKVGDAVKRGQKVATLEAMKMENAINAECDGTITEIKVKVGDSILEGTDIVVIG